MEAIVFKSNTGSTERYAKMLGEKTGLPVYSIDDFNAEKGAEIIYMGWLMAGIVQGYKKVAKKYRVKALCGVGMASSGSQIEDIVKSNQVEEGIPVFTMQGGFDIEKLHGIYKFMMSVMKKVAGKGLSQKTDRTPEEDDMLDMMLNGGDRVDEKNLQSVLDWYNQN